MLEILAALARLGVRVAPRGLGVLGLRALNRNNAVERESKPGAR